MTLVEERLTELIGEILDKKEERQRIEEDLESLKDQLINVLVDNNLTKFKCGDGQAQIMSFCRESLIKPHVLETFEEVNQGMLKGRINVSEHIKTSPVYFVLVKGRN